MTKRARTTKRRKRDSVAAERQRRRPRLRQAAPADLDAKVEEARKLARQDAPLDLIRDYVKIGIALDEELAGRRNASSIRELSSARISFAEQLRIAPRERRLAGELQESISETLAKAMGNARRVLRGKWKSLQEEIRLFGHKDGAKEMYVRAVARLREKRPKLFSPAELAMSPKALFQRVFSKGRSSE